MTDNVISFLPPPHVPRIVTGREPAIVIVLPNVRIENHPGLPMPPGRRLRELRRQSSSVTCGND